ncbi:cupredoxin domain-containing protein [Natrinema salsiterrestre]|uniref:Blue (type 1) copper domain-containing protein n=1 Tax=Natrinema salsiterrestre TaxID=2950540 RepID=A0A9Q4L1U8_9EURY|nr:hypothetical protein [Natrinema salsiterrestre]MDF9746064.1 hypothetical protein [Natrinema salsiterrestre]
MSSSRRRFLELGAIASIGGMASAYGVGASRSQQGNGDGSEDGDGTGDSEEPAVTVTARQEPDNAFYWVLPGERRLSPMVFGTAENPRNGTDLLEARIEQARQLPDPLGEAVPQLLEDLPFLVAAPDEAREPIEEAGEGGIAGGGLGNETNATAGNETNVTDANVTDGGNGGLGNETNVTDGNVTAGGNGGLEETGEDAIAQQVLAEPTLYSDNAEVTSGSFEITYEDHRPYDLPGMPGDTPDAIDLSAQFTDPAGNEYEIEHDHVIQPPIPGYETGGGVLTDGFLHGITGTGSPLFPRAYTYGASWGVGNLHVNGELATEEGFRVIHFMTTQTVRDAQYDMALDEEMPLEPSNTIAGQIHHTHGVVLPIRPTDDGPVYDPVPTAFELPNGDTQPFIHAMWEQDELVEGPFADWEFPGGEGSQETDENGETDAEADIRLVGETQGWQGEAPDDISGTENPTLELEEGTEYVLVWENGDGLQHNFAIEDETGEDLLASEFMGDEGSTQTVTFTASAEMAEYYCQVHPDSMRGSVDVQ